MKKKIVIIALAAVVAAAAVFCGIKIKNRLPFYYDKTGKHQPDIDYTLTIEKSDYEPEVVQRLLDAGVIISATRFSGYIQQSHPEFTWYNGVYPLNANMSYEQICSVLQDPQYRIEYVKITVPEGKNVRGIAQIVEEAGLCTADEFIAAADSYDYDFGFLKGLESRENVGYALEGFLFPATYEIRKDTASAKAVVTEMLRAFSGYVTDSVISRAAEKGLDLNGLMTLASVIQAEAFSKESMSGVSSVFWNRLNSSSLPRLQSDPTTKYAKGLSVLDDYSQAMFDAYDTYTCRGLPAGPTNCPGMDAVNAALEPDDTDYMYFVTDKDGNFYFNKTYAEHVKTCYDIGLWRR